MSKGLYKNLKGEVVGIEGLTEEEKKTLSSFLLSDYEPIFLAGADRPNMNGFLYPREAMVMAFDRFKESVSALPDVSQSVITIDSLPDIYASPDNFSFGMTAHYPTKKRKRDRTQIQVLKPHFMPFEPIVSLGKKRITSMLYGVTPKLEDMIMKNKEYFIEPTIPKYSTPPHGTIHNPRPVDIVSYWYLDHEAVKKLLYGK